MQRIVEVDIAIIGGGIAGLWLLNRLRQLNYSAVLFETNTLGGGQTHTSQGIIHGGTKYALQGSVTDAAKIIADMPSIWDECLKGSGEIDLSDVPVLSDYQYLWSNSKLAGKLAGFFANLSLNSDVRALNQNEFPDIFKNKKFKGSVYALQEKSIDVNALLRSLVKPNQDVIFKIDNLTSEQLQISANGRLTLLEVQTANNPPIQVNAQKYIFTAGGGNEFILNKLKQDNLAMQRRPLHMVLAKTPFDYPLYAHCLGLSATPRITITTHKAHDGKTVWYLGGQLAEEGVKRDCTEQINIARQELSALFPWLDFNDAQFASFFVDRAEPQQPGNKRPDGVYVREYENLVIGWPTKLTLVPQLAGEVVKILENLTIDKHKCDLRALRSFPLPCFATPIWDQVF